AFRFHAGAGRASPGFGGDGTSDRLRYGIPYVTQAADQRPSIRSEIRAGARGPAGSGPGPARDPLDARRPSSGPALLRAHAAAFPVIDGKDGPPRRRGGGGFGGG